MTKQPIVIPELDEREGPHGLPHFEKKAPAHQRMKTPVIEGYACIYNKAHINGGNGKIEAFVPGCFEDSLRSTQPIEFQLQHDNANVVGSTRDHLTLVDRPEGLAFRMRLPKTMIGYVAGRMVDNNQKGDMSVGYRVLQDAYHDIAGHRVRLITAANLLEISLVKRGAEAHAFAYLADGDVHEPPTKERLSGRFQLIHSLHRAIAGVRSINERLAT